MEDFYTDGTYLKNNPTWDSEDAEWKFNKMLPLLNDMLKTTAKLRICEIGCGGGKLLSLLAKAYPQHQFVGWDLANDAAKFWNYELKNLSFFSGDIFKSTAEIQKNQFDLVLLIDVVEHVENPHQFLENVRTISKNCFFHMPLDLSAMSVLFDYKLVHVRKQVGHIHYFTKSIFLELLRESKMVGVKVTFSNSWKDSPKKTLSTKVINIFRYVINFFSPDLNARLLGANTLFALVKNQNE
jgi:SAM-dependent methyltransferase